MRQNGLGEPGGRQPPDSLPALRKRGPSQNRPRPDGPGSPGSMDEVSTPGHPADVAGTVVLFAGRAMRRMQRVWLRLGAALLYGADAAVQLFQHRSTVLRDPAGLVLWICRPGQSSSV